MNQSNDKTLIEHKLRTTKTNANHFVNITQRNKPTCNSKLKLRLDMKAEAEP